MEEKKGGKRERVSCFAWKLRSKFEAEPDHPTIQLSTWVNILVNLSHWRLLQMVGWSGSLETNLDILPGFFTFAFSFSLYLLFPYSKMQFSLKETTIKLRPDNSLTLPLSLMYGQLSLHFTVPWWKIQDFYCTQTIILDRAPKMANYNDVAQKRLGFETWAL